MNYFCIRIRAGTFKEKAIENSTNKFRTVKASRYKNLLSLKILSVN